MAPAKVSVLLATYNGSRFLNEQLESIALQCVDSIDIWASDDGSTDETLGILRAWQARWVKGQFNILQGPSRGYVENFRSLAVAGALSSPYVAFSDQDDVWDSDKLAAAISYIDESKPELPTLYGGRTRLIGTNGVILGMSPLFRRKPCFNNAIVQSLAGGNTMVFNHAAAVLIAESCKMTGFVSHDWWCYQIISGAGGRVIYDPIPRIGYRQHSDNLIGENQGWRARMKRIAAVADGRFAEWNTRNLSALECCRDKLTDESIRILDAFECARLSRDFSSIYNLWKHGVRRQSLPSDVALYLAAALGRL